MSETKRALSTGRVESARMECAGARIDGDKELNPQEVLYHENNDSSIPLKEYVPKYIGMGITEKNCAWCGKVYIPTRPEYAWGECCSYTCCLRYDEQKQELLNNGKGVVLLKPETREDIMHFKNTTEAAVFAGASSKDIRLVCNGLRETAGGYGWRWADEKPLYLVDVIPGYAEEPKRSMAVWVRESTHNKVKTIAKKNGVTMSCFVNNIIEKELKEYEI